MTTVDQDTELPPLRQAYSPPQQQRWRHRRRRWNKQHSVGAMMPVLRVGMAFIMLFGQFVPRTWAARIRSQSPQISRAGRGMSPARAASEGKRKWVLRQLQASANHSNDRRRRPDRNISGGDSSSPDIRECILLFGAFDSGNMDDVIGSMAMEHLLASVAPEQCFWYAHPWEEEGHNQHTSEGGLVSNDVSNDSLRLIQVTPNDAEKVNRFKALVIGGGGIFASRHTPLHVSAFARALTLPIIVLGVGASRHRAKTYSTLAERAAFVSGRDAISTSVLTGVLRDSKDPVVQPDDVALVHDPVLSDLTLTDTKGVCWEKSEGENDQPLCFVLPASNTQASIEMHEHLVTHVVRPGDVFVNVLPTHQEDILRRHSYPGEVMQVSGSAEFKQLLCSCRAIVSARFHGVILGLHMGVPTFGAAPTAHGGKIAGLVIDTMHLPEQLFVVDGRLSREAVDQEVEVVRKMYASHGRRASIHARLSALHDEFQTHARHVLFDIIGVPQPNQRPELLGEQTEGQMRKEKGNKQLTQSEDFFSEAETAQFLPAFSEGGGPAVSNRYVVSSLPPSAEGRETAAAILARAAVEASAAEGLAPVRGTKKEKIVEEGRLTTERVENEAEAARAKASTEEGEHAEASAFKVPTSLTASLIEKVAPPIAASAMAPVLQKETATAATEPHEEDANDKHSLANILLANKEAFRRSPEQEETVPTTRVEPQPPVRKTPLAANRVSKAPGAKQNEPSIAEALMPYSSVFEDNRERNGGKSAAAVSAHDHPHRVTERTERIATVSEASVPGALGDTGTNKRIPEAEGASTNDAIESALIDDDCLVAMLLAAAVVGLALLPSGGAPRRGSASLDDLVAKGATLESEGDVTQRDGDSRTSSDSEVSVPSRRPPSALLAHSAGASTPVAATSSKMIFMLNFTMWVSLSMGFGGYGKVYLLDTRDPAGLLALQGATGVVILCLMARFGVLDLHPAKDLTPAAARQAGSAAFLHTAQALLINIAALMSGVAVTSAMEATEPIIVAVFSYFLLGTNIAPARIAALAMIVAGIALLTFKGNGSAVDGSSGGGGGDYILFSAFVAAGAVCFSALRNVVIKKENPIPPHQTLLACSAAATVVGVGLMLLRSGLLFLSDLFTDGGPSANSEHDVVDAAAATAAAVGWLQMKGVNASLCFVGYNLASFNLLVRLSPVGHAVGNVCRRMLVFASGLLFLGEVMTVRQLGGTAVALFGVLAYNIAGTGSLPSIMELPLGLAGALGGRII